jgi:hypothetical protein
VTLPASGTISMLMVDQELGTGGGGLNLNDYRVRALAGRPSGSISMADLRGKSSYVPMSLVLYSNESGSDNPLYWYPPRDTMAGYYYSCQIMAQVSGGIGPFTYQFSRNNGLGTLTSSGDMYAIWRIWIPRNLDGQEYSVSTVFTCVVTDSTGRQFSVTVPGYAEALV